MRTSIAIYFDLENVDKKLNLKKLLEAVTLDIEDDSTPVFAIKLAWEIQHLLQISENNLKI